MQAFFDIFLADAAFAGITEGFLDSMLKMLQRVFVDRFDLHFDGITIEASDFPDTVIFFIGYSLSY